MMRRGLSKASWTEPIGSDGAAALNDAQQCSGFGRQIVALPGRSTSDRVEQGGPKSLVDVGHLAVDQLCRQGSPIPMKGLQKTVDLEGLRMAPPRSAKGRAYCESREARQYGIVKKKQTDALELLLHPIQISA